jgi:hypothetical protein
LLFVFCTSATAGKRLAALLQSLIAALNAKEIPTGAGLIESFNREAVNKALAAFTEALDQTVQLPVDESVLDQVGGWVTYVIGCKAVQNR